VYSHACAIIYGDDQAGKVRFAETGRALASLASRLLHPGSAHPS
jgi:hypothetical protein